MQSVAVGRSYHLTLIQEDENEGALHRTYHQRAVILIKHQYSAVHFSNKIIIPGILGCPYFYGGLVGYPVL